ncbi:hypothetical protein [Niveispirillum fermenti]|uniref:hypothetical protein n=1 Tax=Niveispirillum fermenti TaxID=1233113 RepID=UPI003A88D3AE
MIPQPAADVPALLAALGRDLAPPLDGMLYDADRWARLQGRMEALVAARQEGRVTEAALGAVLDAVPPPDTLRSRAILHLLRAHLLLDGDGATAAVDCLAADLSADRPRTMLAQADYVLRGVNFALWSNRIRVNDPHAHDLALRRLWHAILQAYRPALAGRQPVARADRQRDLIVLLTGQFVRGMHQPSLDIVDFARTLILRLGRRVVLVNTADGPVSAHFPCLGGFTSSADAELVAIRRLTADGLPIPFRHLPPGFTSPDMAAAMVDEILDMKPDMVLSFGTMSPVADLCRGLVDVVAIPYGSYLPLAEPDYLALPRVVGPGDDAALAAAGLTRGRVLSINYTYAPPPAGAPRSRAALGVPEDAILTAIVGLRLASEVTPAFAAVLDDMVRREPRLFFLFVGPMEEYDHRVAPCPHLAARSRAHGYETDVMGVLSVCDLYLNPPRGGGGSSAAYALSAGVPAYSLAAGDVGTVVGPAFHLAGFGDFAVAAARLADDPAARAAAVAAARARFAQLSSRQEMLRQILDGVRALRATG